MDRVARWAGLAHRLLGLDDYEVACGLALAPCLDEAQTGLALPSEGPLRFP